MTNEPEDDVEKARKERKKRARARERNREREARTAADATPRPEFSGELERLAYALTRSNTRLLVGVTEVIGNLLTNLNDSLWGRPLGGPRAGLGDVYSETARERPFRSDIEDEPVRRRRDESSTRPRSRSRVENVVSRSSKTLANISNDLTQAVRDSAAVLSRSAEELSLILEDVADREYEDDEPDLEDVAEDAWDEAKDEAEGKTRAHGKGPASEPFPGA